MNLRRQYCGKKPPGPQICLVSSDCKERFKHEVEKESGGGPIAHATSNFPPVLDNISSEEAFQSSDFIPLVIASRTSSPMRESSRGLRHS